MDNASQNFPARPIYSPAWVGFLTLVLMGIKLFVFSPIGYWQASRPDETSS